MKARALILFAATSLFSAFALAGTANNISFSEPTNFRRDLTFPGYDSTDGPLRGVGLCLRWKHQRDIQCESLDAQAADVATAFTPAVVDIELGGTLLATLTFAGLQRLDSL